MGGGGLKFDMLNCPAKISFGLDVRKPDRLETRTTGEVLHGIASGEWRDAVTRVRELPADSAEQKAAKIGLPFCTFGGVFTRRSNSALLQHSGQVGIDLDGLSDAAAVSVIQRAVADTHCLAAFRSTRGEGVRLIFRIPCCSPEQHRAAFEQVALHVKRIYGHGPDKSGSDVARASFVSFDRGLWFNPSAQVLPMEGQTATQRLLTKTRCVAPPLYAGQLAVTAWAWFGRYHANATPRDGEAVKTHRCLLDLGKSIALHAYRIKERISPQIIESAFSAWTAEHARQGVRLRCSPDEYRRELTASVEGCERKPWFTSAAEKWLRWTRHPDFPGHGEPSERILFAIRQHCTETGSPEFFLGSRDAGLVAGVHFTRAAAAIRKLIADGVLEKTDARRQPRHAQTYKLKP